MLFNTKLQCMTVQPTRPVLPWKFAIPIIAPRFGAPPVLYPRRFDASPQFNPTLPRPRQFPRASSFIFCYGCDTAVHYFCYGIKTYT